MSWLSSFCVAVLTSLVAAAAASVVADRWVIWYQVPTREGQAALSVIAIVLFGGLAAFLGGLILSRFVGGPGTAGFLRSLGVCSGVMVTLTAIAAAISWSLGIFRLPSAGSNWTSSSSASALRALIIS